MKSRTILLSILLLSMLILPTHSRVSAASKPVDGPTIIKASLIVRAERLMRYWKAPDQDNYWSWMPEISFFVTGPVATGSTFSIDYTNETGAAWYSVDCSTDTVEAGKLGHIVSPTASGHIDKRTTLATGTFGFTIRLKNELSGTNQVMMTGKYKVAKFHVGNTLPAFKNQFEYYVDNDWTLPIGYVSIAYQPDPKLPAPVATMWFRGTSDDSNLAAYLFYNGKQIGSTKEGGGAGSDIKIITSGNDTDPRWERWNFQWGHVRAYNADDSNNDTSQLFFLNKNPGEYEVKVLRNGDLARSMKFTVGANGQIVDNGIATKNGLGPYTIIVPVKILGTGDGKWNPVAWKTEAFYGNPLTGFSAD